jgi:hypothetical protein
MRRNGINGTGAPDMSHFSNCIRASAFSLAFSLVLSGCLGSFSASPGSANQGSNGGLGTTDPTPTPTATPASTPAPTPVPTATPAPTPNQGGGGTKPPPGPVPPTAGNPVCADNLPVCDYVKAQYALGLAAGNIGDWYYNQDGGHSQVNIASHPQVQPYAFSSGPGDIIIGNASLGIGGMWSLVRYYDSNQFNAMNRYNQYLNGSLNWYPSVRDYEAADPADYDESFFMTPYTGLTFGHSGSDRQKVQHSFYILAALRPDVKAKLKEKKLVLPTLQMIYRRGRVASEAEYLTASAHPSAFSDTDKDLDMAKLANSIQVSTIPPMVQLKVLSENFSPNPSQMFFTPYFSEQVFTTPDSIARVYRSWDTEKKMTVSMDDSFDINGRPLTYEYKVLRGDDTLISIHKLNASGSQAEITFKRQGVRLIGVDQRTSDLFIVGAFVSNGAFYSAPAFITVANLRNQQRMDNGSSTMVTFTNDVDPNYMNTVKWLSDEMFFDTSGAIKSFTRKAYAPTVEFTGDGLLIASKDTSGDPLTVSQVRYAIDSTAYATSSWSLAFTDFRQASQIQTLNYSVSKSAQLTVASPFGSGLAEVIEAGHLGTAMITDAHAFVYKPTSNFVGQELVLVRVDDSSAMTSTIYRVHINVTN